MNLKIVTILLLVAITVMCVAEPCGKRSSGRSKGRSHKRRNHRQSCKKKTYKTYSCHHDDHDDHHDDDDDHHDDHDDHHDDHDDYDDDYDDYDDRSVRSRNINQSQRRSSTSNRKSVRVEVSAQKRRTSKNVSPRNQRPVEEPRSQRRVSATNISARTRRPPIDDSTTTRQIRPPTSNTPNRRRPSIDDSQRQIQLETPTLPSIRDEPLQPPSTTRDEPTQPQTPTSPTTPSNRDTDNIDPDDDTFFWSFEFPILKLEKDDDYNDRDYRF